MKYFYKLYFFVIFMTRNICLIIDLRNAESKLFASFREVTINLDMSISGTVIIRDLVVH